MANEKLDIISYLSITCKQLAKFVDDFTRDPKIFQCGVVKADGESSRTRAAKSKLLNLRKSASSHLSSKALKASAASCCEANGWCSAPGPALAAVGPFERRGGAGPNVVIMSCGHLI